MTEIGSTKRYDLEERTLKFAKDVIEFVNVVPKTLANTEIMKQVIRSSGSVGANYIEANEALSKKNFANEDQYVSQGSQGEPVLAQAYPGRWPGGKKTGEALVNEATELMRIFGSIAEKAK